MKLMIPLFCILLTFKNVHAASEAYASCGPRPNLLKRLLTDAEKIRLSCIDEVYRKINERREQEVRELSAYNDELTKELNKVAYKVSYNMVTCENPKNGGKPTKESRRCQEIIALKNRIISRIDHLEGWDQMYRSNDKRHSPASTIEAPCPSKEDLQKMQAVRYFRKNLYKTWERCVSLQPETYFEQ